jgi:DNA-binding beta-propeller fold protein YncE
MKKFLLVSLAYFGFAGAVALASPAGPGYHLIKKIPLGPASEGGCEYFDYVTVDSATRRVYVTHGTEVKMLDADNFSVLGTISGMTRCHGVVVLPELGKGFITDGDAGLVVVFDLKTLKITGEIEKVPGADSILYDPSARLVFTFNGDSRNATAIDPIKQM